MNDNPPSINVQPGEMYLVRRPVILRTILGSCVGVTFWCVRLQAGALCHGVLPRGPHVAGPEAYRYVDLSIRHLARRFDALGARRREVQVKLFGGADVLPVTAAGTGKPTVGAMNCQTALDVLRQEGLNVVASDLGGTRGRTLEFHTGTGEVMVHRLATLNAAEVPGDPRSWPFARHQVSV